MGLRTVSGRERWITAGILLVALVLELAWSRPDPAQQLALRLLGAEGQRIELENGPAFRVGARWLLFFECQGKVGPIRGAIGVEDDLVRELHLFEVREGIDHSAYPDRAMSHSLMDQPARAPLEVEVVSGATISSQLLIDAVNTSLKQWRSAVR